MIKAMLSVVLAICAVSLQGCGEKNEDNSEAYRTQALGAGKKESALALQEAGGCPIFDAAYKEWKSDLRDAVVPEILLSPACNVSTVNLTGVECQKEISQHISDNVLYFGEKDPGFTAWTKTNQDVWKKLKTVNSTFSCRSPFLPL